MACRWKAPSRGWIRVGLRRMREGVGGQARIAGGAPHRKSRAQCAARERSAPQAEATPSHYSADAALLRPAAHQGATFKAHQSRAIPEQSETFGPQAAEAWPAAAQSDVREQCAVGGAVYGIEKKRAQAAPRPGARVDPDGVHTCRARSGSKPLRHFLYPSSTGLRWRRRRMHSSPPACSPSHRLGFYVQVFLYVCINKLIEPTAQT